MTVAERAAALLTSLRENQIAAMPPVERQQLADQCRRVAALADQTETENRRLGGPTSGGAGEAPAPRTSGVLVDLRDGRGQQ